jgi:hypothetical protein
VPATILARLRRFRRTIVVIAAGLVLLQAMLAGLTTAHAAALAANPFAGAICHSIGNADPTDGTAPDNDLAALCCAFCGAVASALPSGHSPVAAVLSFAGAVGRATLHRPLITVEPRAVRAGSSQAPPHSSTWKQ